MCHYPTQDGFKDEREEPPDMWMHFTANPREGMPYSPHSINGLCPLCGNEVVQIGEFADFDETLETINEYTDVCTGCLWESEPYYEG